MSGTERSPRAALALVVGVTVVLSVVLSLVHLPSAVLFASLLGGMALALTSPTELALPAGLFRVAQGTIGVVIGAVVSCPRWSGSGTTCCRSAWSCWPRSSSRWWPGDYWHCATTCRR
jgi:hypothetical protein